MCEHGAQQQQTVISASTHGPEDMQNMTPKTSTLPYWVFWVKDTLRKHNRGYKRALYRPESSRRNPHMTESALLPLEKHGVSSKRNLHKQTLLNYCFLSVTSLQLTTPTLTHFTCHDFSFLLFFLFFYSYVHTVSYFFVQLSIYVFNLKYFFGPSFLYKCSHITSSEFVCFFSS
jgi:hypothetical protein